MDQRKAILAGECSLSGCIAEDLNASALWVAIESLQHSPLASRGQEQVGLAMVEGLLAYVKAESESVCQVCVRVCD